MVKKLLVKLLFYFPKLVSLKGLHRHFEFLMSAKLCANLWWVPCWGYVCVHFYLHLTIFVTISIRFLFESSKRNLLCVRSLLSFWLCLNSSKAWRKIKKAKKRESEEDSPAFWDPQGDQVVMTIVQVCSSMKCAFPLFCPCIRSPFGWHELAEEGVSEVMSLNFQCVLLFSAVSELSTP